MRKAVGAASARPETQSSTEPRSPDIPPKRFKYTRDDLLRLYKDSHCPAFLETAAVELICPGQIPVLGCTLPVLVPLDDPFTPDSAQERDLMKSQSPKAKPLRVVLSSASRNVPSDIQLSGSHLVEAGDNGHPKLNPDAQPWTGSGLDPRLPRYHVSVLRDKVQRGDPFAFILLESGLTDSCGFMSQPPTSQAYEKVWFYKDPHGVTQGPFTSVEMFNWNAAGYFSMSLLVAVGACAHFHPLLHYFSKARVDLKLVPEDL